MAENETDDTGNELEKTDETGLGRFREFADADGAAERQSARSIDFILDIPLTITVELGRTRILIDDLLKLGQGSVVELGKTAGETLEILANDRLIARGEVVVVNEKYGIRITEIISPSDRLEKLG